MSITSINTKPIWLVRAGRHGEQEQAALEKNLVAIGWEELGDISQLNNKEDLVKLFQTTYPAEKPKATTNKANQVWRFKTEIEIGHLVVLPLKNEPAIAIGKIKSDYKFTKNLGTEISHYREVEWLTKDMPRTRLKQDLLYSLGAFLTVCRIQRNDAELRIPKALHNYINGGSSTTSIGPDDTVNDTSDATENVDLETLGRDQIRSFIEQEFAGHRLQELVAAIFEVEGYATVISPPGKDGGVDVLAGKGLLGLEEPRICVQVKATANPAGIDVVNGLLGVVSGHGASYGLVVSMGGFTQDARKKAREQFFKIRLWDSNDLIDATLRNYPRLSEEIQAALPLKQVWVTVNEEE
jgi:restriction system protein